MRKEIILINNMIEYFKSMGNTIEQFDSVPVEAVESVFNFTISNLHYLIKLLEGEK